LARQDAGLVERRQQAVDRAGWAVEEGRPTSADRKTINRRGAGTEDAT
jgi:hypothetical protein